MQYIRFNLPRATFLMASVIMVLGINVQSHAESEYAITYQKAELNSVEGRTSVHERVLKAAKAHCPSYHRTKSLRDVANCIDDVVADLVVKIDHPGFTAFVNGEIGYNVASSTEHQPLQD
ncbi:MAG: UrcA family protein [Pseudomonadota bacterium]